MAKSFLTARWHDLALITYALDPAILAPYLPAGCEADVVDGMARCSLVAFDFVQVRVRGIAWPFHTAFPEINLRFYVKRDGRRGVTFLREFVPRRAIAVIANAVYNEPYSTAAMRSRKTVTGDAVRIEHALRVRGKWQTIDVDAQGPPAVPGEDDPSTWLKEHRWGFGQTRGGRPLSYEVVHPTWAIYRNVRAELKFDFGHVYGDAWRFLNNATPVSTLLAAGSAVEVWPRKVLIPLP